MTKLDCSDFSSGTESAVPPDRLIVDPAITAWPIPGIEACHEQASRLELVKRINRRAERLGTAKLRCDQPILITGHQCGLWHPGILAKDFAAASAARKHGVQWLHLIVDQDAHDSSTIEWPILNGDVLETHALVLWDQDDALRGVPTMASPLADVQDVVRRIEDFATTRGLGQRLDCFISAWQSAGQVDCRNLAEQWSVVTTQMLRPWSGEVAVLHVSDLEGWEPYERNLEFLVADAGTCVKRYNAAVAAQPSAGLTYLQTAREQVELPYWAVRSGEARRRLWANLKDSTPVLSLGDGTVLDRAAWQVLPRALTLTSSLRSAGQGCCAMFIHGTGGAMYDQVMEQWLGSWQPGFELMPRATVTADLRLSWSGIAKAGPACLRHALWRVHHLPHNMDRELDLNGPLAQEKQQILKHMDDDRDRHRRAALFRRLHEINAELAERHHDVIESAEMEVGRCRRGLRNRQAAQRRDWPWLAYDVEQIAGLFAAFQT